MSSEIICVGIVTLDQIYSVPSIQDDVGKVIAASYARHAGGMAATAAATIARLGGKAQFWGRVGIDETGDFLTVSLKQAGVDLSGLLRCSAGITPNSAVLKTAGGERFIAIFPGHHFTATPEQLPLDNITSQSVVLSDVRWPEAGIAAFEQARNCGAKTVLDADISTVDAIKGLGTLADHIIFSEPGLAFFASTEDMSAALRYARQCFDGSLSVTLGANGVLWLDNQHEATLAAPKITALDTTGAGDVFHGAFSLALANGRNFEHCLRFAAVAAAAKCMNGSGWAALPTTNQIAAMEAATYGNISYG